MVTMIILEKTTLWGPNFLVLYNKILAPQRLRCGLYINYNDKYTLLIKTSRQWREDICTSHVDDILLAISQRTHCDGTLFHELLIVKSAYHGALSLVANTLTLPRRTMFCTNKWTAIFHYTRKHQVVSISNMLHDYSTHLTSSNETENNLIRHLTLFSSIITIPYVQCHIEFIYVYQCLFKFALTLYRLFIVFLLFSD